jgi:hypothetical protein
MNTLFKFPKAVEVVEQARRVSTTVSTLIPQVEIKDAYATIANAQLNIATTVAEKFDEAVDSFKQQWKIAA